MRPLFDNIGMSFHRTATNLGVRLAIRRLSPSLNGSNENSSTLLNALRNYLSLDSADSSLFEGIETIRSEHISSERILQYEDLGKGLFGEFSTEGDRLVSRKISDISVSSAPAHEGRLLYSLVAESKPGIGLELGTCLGISAAYQSVAMTENAKGKLYTIEGGADLAAVANSTLEQLEITNVNIHVGSFQEILPELLPQLQQIDYAFIDGHHDGQAIVNYFEMIKPYLTRDSLVLFDDLSWSVDMRKAWNKIRTDSSVKQYADLFTIGICTMS